MTLSLKQYFNNLEASINNFVVINNTTSEDLANYQLQKQFLEDVLTKGRKMRHDYQTMSLFALFRSKKEFEKIILNGYKNSGGVPTISGPLSLAFAEQVFLPTLLRTKDIKRGSTTIKNHMGAKAIELQKRIDQYKNPVPVSKFKRAANDVNNNLSLLEQKKQRLQFFIDQFHSIDKKEFAESNLKTILDPENKHSTLSETLESFYFPEAMKQKLLAHEKNNSFLYRKIFYRPLNILEQCLPLVTAEQTKVAAKIEQEKLISTYRNSLLSCLDALLKNRKSDFVLSNKWTYVNSIDLTKLGNDVNALNQTIVQLKTKVCYHREGSKWFGWWTFGRKSTSRGIFDKFFDETNTPKSLSPRRS